MNITELRDRLSDIAGGLDDTQNDKRADQVFARVRATRVRRAITAGGVAAVAGAVAVGALVWLPSDHKSAPQPTKTFRLNTVRDHGVPFYTDPGGNRLLAHKVGAPGQDSVQLSVTDLSGALFPVAVCTATYTKAHPYYVHILVNGNPTLTMGCAGGAEFTHPEHRMFLATEEPITNVVGGFALDNVAAGIPTTVQAWISVGLNGSITKVPGAQVGVALYAHDPDMAKVHNLWLARQVVIDDHTYALAARTFKDLTTGGSLTLTLPPSQSRLWVVGGVGSWSSPAQFTTMQGTNYPLGRAAQAPMTLDLGFPLSSKGTETISIHGKPGSTGFLYLLAYERID